VLILFVANGPTKGKVIELTEEIHLIGRQSEEVQLNDSRVSRRHAELIPGDDGWLIRDVGSSNGTAVNGKWLAGDSPVAVNAGDRIQVGRTLMIVGDGESRVMPKLRRSSRSKSKSKSRSSSKPKAEVESIAPPLEEPIDQPSLDDDLAAVLGADEEDAPDNIAAAAPLSPALDEAVDDDDLPLNIDDDADSDVVSLDSSPVGAARDEPRDAPASIAMDDEDDDRLELTIDEPESADEPAASASIEIDDPLDAIALASDEVNDDDEEILIASEDSLAGIEVDLSDDAELAEVDDQDIAALAAARDAEDSSRRNDEPAEALLDASLVDDTAGNEADDRAIADVARVLYPQADDEPAGDQVDLDDMDDQLAQTSERERRQREADAELVEAMDEQIGEDRLEDTDAHEVPPEDPIHTADRSAPEVNAADDDLVVDDEPLLDQDTPDTPEAPDTPETAEVRDAPDDRVAASFADLDALFADLDKIDDDADDDAKASPDRAQAMHFSPYDEGQPQLDAHAEQLDTAVAIAELNDAPAADEMLLTDDALLPDDDAAQWSASAIGDEPDIMRDGVPDDVTSATSLDEPIDDADTASDAPNVPDVTLTHDLLVDEDAGDDADADSAGAPLDIAAVLGVSHEPLVVDDEPDLADDLQTIDAALTEADTADEVTPDTDAAVSAAEYPHAHDAAPAPAIADDVAAALPVVQDDEPAAALADDEHPLAVTMPHAQVDAASAVSHSHDEAMDVTVEDRVGFDDVDRPLQDEPDDEDIQRAAMAEPQDLLDEPVVDDAFPHLDGASDRYDALPEPEAVIAPAVPRDAPADIDVADDVPVEPQARQTPPARPMVLGPLADAAVPRPPSMSPIAVPSWDAEEAVANARRLHPAWKVLIPVVIAVGVVVGAVELNSRYELLPTGPSQPETLDDAMSEATRKSRLDRDLEAARKARIANTPAATPLTGPDAVDPTRGAMGEILDVIQQEIKSPSNDAAPKPVDPRD
jgi:pilus assembly protein FimV